MRVLGLNTIARLLAVLALTVLAHGTASAGSMVEECAKDVETYCGNVEPGNGRLAACLYAHEDKISEGCDAATMEISDQLDWFFSTLVDAVQTCLPDIEKFCSGVTAGEGRLYLCLGENEDSLMPECKQVVNAIDARLIKE